MKRGVIYAIYNKETGQYFIGQTDKQVNKRWQEHLHEAQRMNASPLYKSIRKYGVGKFNIRVIEECPIDKLNERERHWISEYDSYNNGYNENKGSIDKCIKKDVIIGKVNDTLSDTVNDTVSDKREFTVRGDGKHKRIKVKTIDVNTLEEKFYDSITECAEGLNIDIRNLHSYMKKGWKVKGHRVIKLEDKPASHAIYGLDKITNRVRYTFPSLAEAGRTLGTGNTVGVTKSLRNPHKYTWKGCYWFYQ